MERDAFERALRPLLRRSSAYAVSFLHDRTDAEDAVQKAALRAWQGRAQFDDRRPFAGWWFAILRNQCLDELRSRGRGAGPASHDEAALATPADESVLDSRALAVAMGQLPEIHRDVLRLRYFGELNYDELAQVLDIPKGTVMSRLHLARKSLASLIAEEKP